jgi:hypothetical protein
MAIPNSPWPAGIGLSGVFVAVAIGTTVLLLETT